MTVLTCRLKAYIQPFERELAIRELAALAKAQPHPEEKQLTLGVVQPPQTSFDRRSAMTENSVFFKVETSVPANFLVRRLAYWEAVSGKEEQLTDQVLREATVNVVRNGVQPSEIRQLVDGDNLHTALPNRRCLRYGTHGLHEYRGKFFPQLVRSLLNIARLDKTAVVADPMCGSGTAAVESLVAGCRAIALDRNPLSTFITRTKCAVLAIKPDILISAYEQIRARLLSSYLRKNSRLEYFRSLPERDQMYLTDWFSEQVLMDLDAIAVQINEVEKSEIRDLMKIALSNILRKVSWQKDDDLRVRREIRLDAEIDPIREYLEELGRSVRLLIAFLYRIDRNKIGSFDIRDGDARSLETELRDCVGKVDAVITSPPYATALPYLDTDRLSLCYLGLLSRPMHRNRDLEMIGNREITDKCRQVYWQEFRKNKDVLPQSVSELIEGIDRRNSTHPTGFRRRNLAALLARYFSDIKKVIGGIKRVLRPKGFACLVIGSNHTIAGGERVDINTPLLISDIAKGAGLDLCSRIPMEMLVSRDIFRRNAGVSEEIILLRKRSSP